MLPSPEVLTLAEQRLAGPYTLYLLGPQLLCRVLFCLAWWLTLYSSMAFCGLVQTYRTHTVGDHSAISGTGVAIFQIWPVSVLLYMVTETIYDEHLRTLAEEETNELVRSVSQYLLGIKDSP